VKAVDDISFEIQPGETLGLVGESGCGKTTAGRVILRLIERTAGEVVYRENGSEVNLATLQGEKLRQFRRHVQMIFQDPFSSLNPRMRVSDLISEPIRALENVSERETDERVRWLTEAVGLNVQQLERYPHAFSGGQRQRICIARALAVRPRLVVCDEPVSALDVSVRAQIINLLKDLQQEFGLTYLFVAHDLSVVENISTRVAVMYAGRIVEIADNRSLFHQPRHPYTAALMRAVPVPDPTFKGDLSILQGEVADASDLPTGCAFHPRCPFAQDICRTEMPQLRTLGTTQRAACHFADQIQLEIPAKKN
jgi:peptide/nickel transport system ATP-binding protein